MDNLQKKLQELKKDSKAVQKKALYETKDKSFKISQELANTETRIDSLQKKFDIRLAALDKAVGMASNLEEKIRALNKEKNK